MMTDRKSQDAWDRFWAQSAARAGNAPVTGGGIAPGWQGIAEAQRRIWHEFARRLPKAARVLDIGTGAGQVITNLLEKRRDIKAVGVDRANTLPTAPRGAKLRGGVDMAQMPFPDARFAAVTGQFAFEYGDVERTAVELARVLQPGGSLALLTHRSDGPITAHNRKRREQIGWALEEQQLAQIARRSLGLRTMGVAAIPKEVIAAPEMGAQKFGAQSAAWEIAEALRRTLHLGRNDSVEGVTNGIAAIEAQAENELGRIASLEAAAATASDPAKVPGALIGAGFVVLSAEPVFDTISGQAFADLRMFRHAG